MFHKTVYTMIPPDRQTRVLHIGNVDQDFVKSLGPGHDIAGAGWTGPSEPIYDAVVAIDVFERASDARNVMRQIYKVLKPGGWLASSFANLQYGHRIFDIALGDDIVDEHPYTLQGFFRALLDEGFAPQFRGGERGNPPPTEISAFLSKQGERQQALADMMSMIRIGFAAERLPEVKITGFDGVALLVCTNDERVFRNNISISPEFNDPRNEVFILKNPKNPAEVFDAAKNSKKELLIFVHHDLYLPRGWSRRFHQQFMEANKKEKVGVAGLFGVFGNRNIEQRGERGHIVDLIGARTMVRRPLPSSVRIVDGLCLAVHRDSPIRPDPELGFHFYDADMCMQAEERWEQVIAVDAPALHSSFVLLPPPSFEISKEKFKKKWAHRLPVETPCALVE